MHHSSSVQISILSVSISMPTMAFLSGRLHWSYRSTQKLNSKAELLQRRQVEKTLARPFAHASPKRVVCWLHMSGFLSTQWTWKKASQSKDKAELDLTFLEPCQNPLTSPPPLAPGQWSTGPGLPGSRRLLPSGCCALSKKRSKISPCWNAQKPCWDSCPCSMHHVLCFQ